MLTLDHVGIQFQGLWLGMGFGLATQTIALLSIILCTNWDKVVRVQLNLHFLLEDYHL